MNATNFEGSHIIRKFIGIILPIIYKPFSSKGCEQIVELIGLHVSNDQYYCEVLKKIGILYLLPRGLTSCP